MQPTYPNLDAIRNNHQITNNNYVYRNSTNTCSMKGTNKVDKTPNEDTVEIGDKPKMSKTKKILFGIGAALVSATGIVYGVKKAQVKNIKNIQKSFKEIFMRDDITVEQTREVMKRYKEIEKITDREEYAKALFEEVKKNYGMEKSNIKLIFENQEGAGGFCRRDNSAISITPATTKKEMMNIMHHEFRHAKQHEVLYNVYPEKAKAACMREARARDWDEIVDNYIDQHHNGVSPEELNEVANRLMNEAVEKRIKINFGTLDKKNISDKYLEYAEKIKNASENYVHGRDDVLGYWNNFTEVDARRAGELAEKYIKGEVFNYARFRDNFVMAGTNQLNKLFKWVDRQCDRINAKSAGNKQ